MKLVPLSQNQFAMVDDADFPRVAVYKWSASKPKYRFYAVRRVKSKIIFMHRFLLSAPENLEVDHKDGNGLNNQRYNIRLATKAQNTMGFRRRKGRYRGVFWQKSARKWRAQICYNRKRIHLGYYPTEVAAARGYDGRAKELFGEFAQLNFPPK